MKHLSFVLDTLIPGVWLKAMPNIIVELYNTNYEVLMNSNFLEGSQ